MKKIPFYRGYIKLPFEESLSKTTKDAVCFKVAKDYYNDEETFDVWIPRSIIVTLNPNRLGTAEIRIPLWFIEQKGFDKNLITEINEYPAEPDVVWA